MTLIQRGRHLLTRDDPTLVDTLEQTLVEEGVDLRCDTAVERVERTSDGWCFVCAVPMVKRASPRTVSSSQVGRRPRLDGMGLENTGVKTERTGITVDDHGCTNVSHIYASGDVAVGPNFTHWAEHSSKIAITNTVLGVPTKLQPEALVWTTLYRSRGGALWHGLRRAR